MQRRQQKETSRAALLPHACLQKHSPAAAFPSIPGGTAIKTSPRAGHRRATGGGDPAAAGRCPVPGAAPRSARAALTSQGQERGQGCRHPPPAAAGAPPRHAGPGEGRGAGRRALPFPAAAAGAAAGGAAAVPGPPARGEAPPCPKPRSPGEGGRRGGRTESAAWRPRAAPATRRAAAVTPRAAPSRRAAARPTTLLLSPRKNWGFPPPPLPRQPGAAASVGMLHGPGCGGAVQRRAGDCTPTAPPDHRGSVGASSFRNLPTAALKTTAAAHSKIFGMVCMGLVTAAAHGINTAKV